MSLHLDAKGPSTSTQEQIHSHIDEQTAIADERRRSVSSWFGSLVGGASISFLNGIEIAELHELKENSLATVNALRRPTTNGSSYFLSPA